MKMLITGGAGFVGSHLCDRFTRAGHQVVCLDNFESGDLNNIRQLLDCRNFKLVKGDIRDTPLLDRAMRDVEAVFHLAAQVHVDRSYFEPRLTYDVNVMGTLNVLEVARENDVRTVVHASTSEVYGSALYAPIDERHPLNALHPYGASKVGADRLCYSYRHTFGMDIRVLRPFNIFGPRQRAYGYGGVISIFARRVLSNQPPIVYGDGRQTRDYTYVADVVDGYEKMLSLAQAPAEPVNLGTGVEIPIVDLARAIIKAAGKEDQLAPVHVEPRVAEVGRLIASAKCANEVLGWKPQYDLARGLTTFVEWFRNFGFEERVRGG